jgi:hypothetical protein
MIGQKKFYYYFHFHNRHTFYVEILANSPTHSKHSPCLFQRHFDVSTARFLKHKHILVPSESKYCNSLSVMTINNNNKTKTVTGSTECQHYNNMRHKVKYRQILRYRYTISIQNYTTYCMWYYYQ